MKIIRYQYKKYKQKKAGIAIILFCIIIAILTVSHIGSNNDSLTKVIEKEVKNSVYMSMIKEYVPVLAFSVTDTSEKQSLSNLLITKIQDIIPIYGYMKTMESMDSYDTQIESKLTYEMILACEAMDENYIDDVTGEVIPQAEDENAGQVLASAESENESVRDTEKVEENTESVQATEATEPEAADTVADVADETADTVAEAAIVKEPVVTYQIEKLNDFDYLIKNFYVVDRTTTINSSQLNAEELLSKSMKLTTTADQPQILIYHTHSQERYVDSTEDVMTGVVGVGEYLAQLLRDNYGLNVMHHLGEYDVEDRDHAYSRSGPALEQILAENPSIEVVIDVHRDGIDENTHLFTEINGVQMATIMFFNGLSRTTSQGDIDYLYNPYIEDNLAFSFQLQLQAAQYYPGLTRPIYLKGYRYNMHYCPKSLLVEVGAQTNTFQEAKNAMVPLADILNSVINN